MTGTGSVIAQTLHRETNIERQSAGLGGRERERERNFKIRYVIYDNMFRIEGIISEY